MNKLIKKANKGNLKNSVVSSLEREYEPLAVNSRTQNADYEENEEDENNDFDIDNVNELEQNLSEVAPMRIRKRSAEVRNLIPNEKVKIRVGLHEKLSNGLTPYEIMYGKQENDYNLLNKFLE